MTDTEKAELAARLRAWEDEDLAASSRAADYDVEEARVRDGSESGAWRRAVDRAGVFSAERTRRGWRW